MGAEFVELDVMLSRDRVPVSQRCVNFVICAAGGLLAVAARVLCVCTRSRRAPD